MLAKGYRVRALVRNPAKAAALANSGATLIEGDLAHPQALMRLVADCDAVVHCAGAVRGNSQADFDRVNVAGTAAMLAAANAQARPPRFLLLSSLAAREPQLSWYAHSKRAGESLLQQTAGLEWMILRPPAVYGPGDQEMLPIFEWMRRGIALVPGSAEARTSLIHVSDLVSAILACLQGAAATGQTLAVCDGQPNGYSWRDMADIAARHWSRPVRLWRVPRRLLDGIAAINSAAARASGRAPMLTPPKLRELRHSDWVVDNHAVTAATGWTPAVGLEAGLATLKIPPL